ncbi:MAG: GAF domain-containing protein, partial [Kiritimatiellales bacterium]|nr:GAF domain-containing protein [Kiritimatiellales bacterium]
MSGESGFAETRMNQERIHFEILLADLSARFINLPADQVDAEIEDAQLRVCQCLGFDLSALWQWEPGDPGTLLLTHYYRPLGGPPVPDRMDAQQYFPWSQQQVLAGRTVAIPSTENVQEEAFNDRETWRHYGIKTTLTIPLAVGGGAPFGAVSFNDMQNERTWSAAQIKRLELVAGVFANALERKRVEQALRLSETRLSLAAASAGAGLWSLNLETR